MIEDDDAAADAEGAEALQEAVRFGEQAIGGFALGPRAGHSKSDRALVATIARELGGALRMATLVEESRLMATTDALTGLLNRRSLLESTLRELARTKRYGDQLAVILLDVDHFKQVNDRRGHAAGDVVLAAVGNLFEPGAAYLRRRGALGRRRIRAGAAFDVAGRRQASRRARARATGRRRNQRRPRQRHTSHGELWRRQLHGR